MKMLATISVKMKPGVLDAEGKNVQKSLDLLGLQVDSVAFVRTYQLLMERATEQEVQAAAELACDKLLANPVVHDYSIVLEKAD